MSESRKTCAQCDAELPADSPSSLCPECLLQIGFETRQTPGQPGTTGYQPTFLPPTVEELAPRFPQLEILKIIGHGGMGVVYQARQKELDRIVALKILRPAIGSDPSFAERFQREARALAKLNHPHIITVYDFGRRDTLFYFIMEYVDGTNLRHLERTGELNPQEALSIVPQICSALQYAHDNGIVHRDIKPENILINREGDVRIADFGLARLAGVTDDVPLTGTWQVMGTPHYMAPEQIEKPSTVDHRADIYSLGVVIYELLTGELPLGRFRLPSEKVHVDVRLDEVVLRSLDKEPERRYQHVTDVASAVQDASSPRHTSRMTATKEWFRGRSAPLAKGAELLKTNSVKWKSGVDWMIRWCGERRPLIGTLLMWGGAADALLSLVAFGDIFRPLRDETAFLSLMTMIAGSIAFFFGRQLRRNSVGVRLKWAAFFCLLPWLGFFFVLGLVRILLTAAGLFALSFPGPIIADKRSQKPDIIDRAVGMARSLRKILSPRVLLFTILGVAGWSGLCAAAFAIFGQLWYHDYLPTTYSIYDKSALDVRPVSEAYQRLDIESSMGGATRGFVPGEDILGRDRLRLSLSLNGRNDHTVHSDNSGPVLDVNLNEGMCHLTAGGVPTAESMPISETTVADWMAVHGIDTTDDRVKAEVAHLCDVLRLMRKTRGMCSQLTTADRVLHSTLSSGLSRIMQNGKVMSGNLIPVGQLLSPELFIVPASADLPFIRIRPQSWAVELFFGSFLLLWLFGLLRVGLVLYRLLWKPAYRKDSLTTEHAVRIWRRCWFGLAVAGAIIFVSSAAIKGSAASAANAGNPWFEKLLADRSAVVVDSTLIGFLVIGLVILLSGLLAQSAFRRIGWFSGAAGATLAVLVLPLNLITFPTGLAAWIALTDSGVRMLFRRPQRSQ